MERLQKAIAQAGIASRRRAEMYITNGEVKVNGVVVKELGTKVSASDTVVVKGIEIQKEEPVYYLFYKPRGVITTVSDDKGRKTVLDFFEDVEYRIYPVGRLDYDTSGILLLTNDGDLDNKLTHPKYEVDKTYVAKVKGTITIPDLKQLRDGVMIDGKKTAKASASLVKPGDDGKSSIVSLTIHEGRNHQVKKMFDVVGHPVQKLSRTDYGFLNLNGLTPGEYRRLKPHEVEQLKKLTNDK
ncbi:pseudouridine synthase [Lentilactobacillus kosonis]|uniref:Pseudouridine synthase n=1 Tax=Lentilactobacillus kosonis TaxID=2810561 RepID=A0A401FL27_9LACO|nr:pseudouridine synthase [Lentilactobacillus kosonis]GAY73053.1 ribosomal large subunit pseudouridine synthase B [Lentilactobacillus kosonis]